MRELWHRLDRVLHEIECAQSTLEDILQEWRSWEGNILSPFYEVCRLPGGYRLCSWKNGNRVVWMEQAWLYEDGQPAVDPRPCPKCHEFPLQVNDGEQSFNVDACLGWLPNIAFACCGHGVCQAYVQFPDGHRVLADGPDGVRAAMQDTSYPVQVVKGET